MELRLDACDATRPADRVGRDRFARGCCDVADSTEWEAAMGRRFGDPIVGVAKWCHLPPAGAPSGGWSQCAAETGVCAAVSGQRSRAVPTARSPTGRSPGTRPARTRPSVTLTAESRRRATQGSAVRPATPRPAPPREAPAASPACGRLHSERAGRFTYKSFTGGTACTNAAFGIDPLPGVPKSC